MPFPQQLIAQLIKNNPQANDEEILALARGASTGASDPTTRPSTGSYDPNPISKAWEWANQPLVSPELGDGFLAGAGETAAKVLSTPANLASLGLAGGGALAGARGLLGISRGARYAEAALNAPLVAEGGAIAAEGLQQGDALQTALGAGEAVLGGIGARSAMKHAFPPKAVARAYNRSVGLPPPKDFPRLAEINPQRSMAIADAYEAMPHAPTDPATAAAYEKLGGEISDQFAFLRDRAGLKAEPWTQPGQPYGSSEEMLADVTKNNHLWYFPSESGFGDGAITDNPLLQPGRSGLPQNDELRVVHDYLGHATSGSPFGARGEETAWMNHGQTLTPEAMRALTTETRGQNSWVNFGPQMRGESGQLLQKGDPGFKAPQDRAYAEQKTGLLPDWAQDPQGMPLPTWDYDDIIRRHTAGGGSTTNPLKGDLVGQPYYAVAAYPERQAIVDKLDRESLEAYIQRNQDLLGDEGNSIGSWLDDDPGSPTSGKVYLDISRTIPDREAALRLGAEKNQKAIFDLGSLEAIPLEGMSGRVGGVPLPEAPAPAGGLSPAPSTSLAAVAAPAGLMAAGQVAEDPETGAALEKYGALGTALASGAALGAAIRKGSVAPQKAAASRLASMMMLGVGKRERQAILKGMNPADAAKVEAAAGKMLEQQAAKAVGKLPNLKSLLGTLSGVAETDVRWYDETSEGLQRIFGEDGPLVGKFLAATSSNATVKSNVSLALKAYRQYKAGEPFQGYLPVVKQQLERITKGEPVGGRKVDNFAKALAGDQDAVVVDRWMLRAFGLPRESATPHQYDLIEEAVRRVAKETGKTPRQVQAGLWFAAKNKTEAERGVRNQAPPFETLIKDALDRQSKSSATSAR